MANSFSNESLVTFSLAVLVHGAIVLYLVLRIWGCNPLYGKNQHSVIFVVWDFEEICNQVVISCFLLPVPSGQVKGAVSRQSSLFCLILPITRPQSLWNLK